MTDLPRDIVDDLGLPSRAAHMEPDDIAEAESVPLADAPLRALVREALALADGADLGQLRRRGWSLAEFERRLQERMVDLLTDVGVTRIYLEEGE